MKQHKLYALARSYKFRHYDFLWVYRSSPESCFIHHGNTVVDSAPPKSFKTAYIIFQWLYVFARKGLTCCYYALLVPVVGMFVTSQRSTHVLHVSHFSSWYLGTIILCKYLQNSSSKEPYVRKQFLFTHWSMAMHINIPNLLVISSGSEKSPARYQATTWTSADL